MSRAGEFKICPFCKEQIRAEAVKCIFCGEWLENCARPSPETSQEREERPELAQFELNEQQTNSAADLSPQQSSIPDRPLAQVEQTVSPSHAWQIRGSPLLPLLILAFWILWHVVPLAIKNGASGALGIVLGTLCYCTTPESILVLPVLGIWFWTARRNHPFAQIFREILRQPVWPALVIIAMCLTLVAVSYTSIHSALESRSGVQRQGLSALKINPDALKLKDLGSR